MVTLLASVLAFAGAVLLATGLLRSILEQRNTLPYIGAFLATLFLLASV